MQSKNLKKNSFFNKYNIVLIIILLIACYFRFNNYSERISLGADSSRDAFVAIYGAEQFQLPLIGPFTSIAPVVTGPWYWFQLILSRIIFPLPYSPWIYVGILSVLSIIIAFRIGMLLESKMFGLILAFIVALSPDQISTASQLNNPIVIGFFSTLVFWLFAEIVSKKRPFYWGLPFGISLGLTLTTHYQAIPLFPFLFFPLIFRRFKTFYLAVLGFSMTVIPLFVFELNNHWYNTKNIIDYLQFGQYRIWVSVRWLTFISDFWPGFWTYVIGGKSSLGMFFMVASPIILLNKFITDVKKRKLLFCIGISFIIGVIFVRYYRGEKYFGYLRFFHPYIFLFTGYVIYSLIQRKLLLGIFSILLYLFLVIPSAINASLPSSFTIDIYKIYNEIISKWGDKEYAIFNCPNTDIDRFRALSLVFVLQGNYNPDSDNRLLYYYGSCKFPDFVQDDRIINPELSEDKINFFPKINIVYDVSIASEKAILEKGAEKFTTKQEYQRAARWWFDEQP